MPIDVMPAQYGSLDNFLFCELLQLIRGKQLAVALRGPESESEAYRLIYYEMERMQPTRKVATVEELLSPQFGEAPVWRKNWIDWEAEVRRGTPELGMIFSDDVKIGIVRPRTPRILRQHLRLSAMEYGGD